MQDESLTRVASGELFRQSAPVAGPFPSINIGEFETATLSNGLTLIVVENHKLPKIAYQLIVSHDPVSELEKSGVADICGELLSRGTRTRSKSELDDRIDFLGANLQTSSSGVYGSTLSKYEDEFLSLFLDILLHPAFPEKEFNKLKLKAKSRLQSVRTEPSEIAYNICSAVIFGDNHPYADIMTPETLDNITLGDCRNHYETYWRPNCSYLAIVGDTTMEEVMKNVAPKLSLWNKRSVPAHQYEAPQLPDVPTICFVDRPGAVQSELRVTYPLDLHPANQNRIPAAIMNHILGGGAFSGYLMHNLREDKGYTYGVRSLLQIDHVCAEFRVSTSVGTEVTVSAAQEVFNEMDRIRATKVDADHLVLAKNSMVGSFARSLENPQTLANRVLNMLRFQLPDDFYQTFADKLSRVTAEEIQVMANEYIQHERAYMVIVGDYDALSDNIKEAFPTAEIRFFDHFGRKV